MKKMIIMIIAVLLTCLAVYMGISFSAKNAGDINSYEIGNITSIEMLNIGNNTTVRIDEKDKIRDTIRTLRNDYDVRKILKTREMDIFEKYPMKYCVIVYSKEDTAIVDQYFLTSFKTVVVIDVESINGLKRTGTYESTSVQTEIYKAIENTIKDYE